MSFLETHTNSWLVSRLVHGGINIFFNGELAVFVFWFLSAYVISIKLFKRGDKSYVIQALLKRYVRLAIPVLVSVLLPYILISLGLMFNKEVAFNQNGTTNEWLGHYYDFDPSFILAIKSGLWDTFFDIGGQNYNPVLWSINPEFYGSLFCFIIFIACGKNRFRFYFYFILSTVAFLLAKYWLIVFILGHILCDAKSTSVNNLVFQKFLSLFKNQQLNLFYLFVLLLLGGLYNYYSFFYVPVCALIVIVILHTQRAQAFLMNKYLVWLGKVSFGLYLIHFPIICSFSCFLYLKMPLDNHVKTIVISVLTIFFSLVFAHLFTKYIDQLAKNGANGFGRFVYQSILSKYRRI